MTSAKTRDGLSLGRNPYRYVSEYWSMQAHPELVASFIRHSELPLPPLGTSGLP